MLKLLLLPFAILYDAVTSVRNALYDRGYKPVASFEIPVIGIGNLAVGGTGKTPMVEYLIRLLTPEYKIAALSRGYGRSTKGIRLGSENETAKTLGDEPFQIYQKFSQRANVVVGEDRALAIPYILHQYPDTQVILMDDAFQHRRVKPSFQILLTDYTRPFYKDYVLPAGRLRESARGANRADVIVVTKCPFELTDDEIMSIESAIRDYSDKPLFFSRIRYGVPLPINHDKGMAERVVLVSGIANSKVFENYVRDHYQVIQHFEYRDHHEYTSEEIKEIAETAERENAVVLTTEKDAVKLQNSLFLEFLGKAAFFYLPIETEFIKNGKEFDEMLLNVVSRHSAS